MGGGALGSYLLRLVSYKSLSLSQRQSQDKATLNVVNTLSNIYINIISQCSVFYRPTQTLCGSTAGRRTER
jgi:hypothetical protein